MGIKSYQLRYILLILWFGVWAIYIGTFSPIAQSELYHQFADARTWWLIPNAANVLSNIPFLMVGVWGLYHLRQVNKDYRCFYTVFFIAVSGIGFGSAYYHWHPDNAGLFWDRLWMSIAFMSVFSALLAERCSLKLGRYLFLPLLLLGMGSVIYWYFTQLLGRGDLRLYIFVQYSLLFGLPFLLFLFPSGCGANKYLWMALLFYFVAKLFELWDKAIYQLTDHVISGHSIKHLCAALACYVIYLYMRQRQPVVT